MRIALDATYSVDPQPSGIAVYSRSLWTQLTNLFREDQFLPCFRPKQYRRVMLHNRQARLLLPPFPTFRADLFHALNQRVDRRPSPIVVTTFHDLFVMTGEYSTPEFRKRFADQARQAAANSDFVIAVSEFTAAQVRDLLHFDSARIRVVHHGIPLPRPMTRDARQREPIILFVGALQTRKNLIRLIEAFETIPPPWSLVLAGAPIGFGVASILQRVAQSSARDRIQLPGYLPQAALEQHYARASVFAFPSLDEGFGIPVLEAMASGVPVLTSNRSALAEVAGDAARLVDPMNANSIAEGLHHLTLDGALRIELSTRGRKRVQQFSELQTAKDTYAVYKEATAS